MFFKASAIRCASPVDAVSEALYTPASQPLDFTFLTGNKQVVTECRSYYAISVCQAVFIEFQLVYCTLGFSSSLQVTVIFRRGAAESWVETENYSAAKLHNQPTGTATDCICLPFLHLTQNSIHYVAKRAALEVNLCIAQPLEPFQFGAGGTRSVGDGSIFSRFVAGLKLSGTLQHDGCAYEMASSLGSIVHVVQNGVKPHNAMSKAWFAYFVDAAGSSSLTLIDNELPKRFEGRHHTHACLTVDGKLVSLFSTASIRSKGSNPCLLSGYQQPADFEYAMSGRCFDGQSVEVLLTAPKLDLFRCVDILGQLPSVARLVIKTFVAKPYMFLWLSDAVMRVRIGGREEISFSGKVFQEHSILHE